MTDTALIKITRKEARRFQVRHQRLSPPRQEGDILELIRHLGCIQYDPINITGCNPDMVLQARIKGYRPEMLSRLLYEDRHLYDGFDKMAAICLVEDWPYFKRRREVMKQYFKEDRAEEWKLTVEMLKQIRKSGPFDPSKAGKNGTTTWFWGRPVRLERAAAEALFHTGDLIVSNRTGTRRIFDLPERQLPNGISSRPDPYPLDEDYQDWHVLRRMGGMGIVQLFRAEAWLGISAMKTPELKASIERLISRGKVKRVEIKENPDTAYFIRTSDIPVLESTLARKLEEHPMVFLSPLDNLVWDRRFLGEVFEFDYIWEMYKKAEQRRYGFYTIPVLYGDKFVARFEPVFDKKKKRLTIKNWWWEETAPTGQGIVKALRTCLKDFCVYLGDAGVELGENVREDPVLKMAAG